MDQVPRKLIFITGPTGIGKTRLSLDIAKHFQAEIISMDSMQVYKGMDIGTDKLKEEDREGIPHHLLDVVEPGARFTARDYKLRALEAVKDIYQRGHLPIFVGGTGLYLSALVNDFQFADFNIDRDYRRKLNQIYDQDKGETLYKKVQAIDPKTAEKIGPPDRKKLVRAMEVYRKTGKPMSATKKNKGRTDKWDSLVFVLNKDRQALYADINQRVVDMVDEGLLEEVLGLVQSGFPLNSQAIAAIGYQEVVWYFRGFVNKEEMVRLIQRASRRYAKRQITWFRRDKENIWLDKDELDEEELKATIIRQITDFMGDWLEDKQV